MPRLSIALPVYNGEPFVAAAVESLLGQTFRDFELAIVDNASTDRTAEICRSFADPRVRYHRNERNIGGGPNWNHAFDLASRAPFFKWAAHDDVYAPTFLERCVEALDRDPGAVLAFTGAEFIDQQGKAIAQREQALPLDSPDLHLRFDALIPPFDCLEIFGVIRRDALRRRPVMGLHLAGDEVLLLDLALQGRFIELPDVLFSNRRHPTQAGTRYQHNPRAWNTWWNPDAANHRIFPIWRRHAEQWRVLFSAPMSLGDRVRCSLTLARWMRWRRRLLFDDLTFYLRRSAEPGAGGATQTRDEK
jgi:glycosyltransferase involved in cell wall biosynthesis